MKDDLDETRLSQHSTTPSDLSKFAPGQVVGGKFKVISRLGAGGMGTVYRVEQIFLRQEFALKTMDQHATTPVLLQRFQIEAQAACSLNHPNLVKVHDFGTLEDGNPYLVMDYIDGLSFAEYLKKNGPMSIETAAPLFSQACFGLMAAHEKSIVHRDIKPGNLMLLNNMQPGAEGSVKLVDFGIAKIVNREEGEIQALTRTGEIFGSPLYMSPEQCSSGTVDQRSDIYSLGCVLFEMLTGTPPHMGQSALRTMMLHQAGEIPTLREATLGGKEFPQELELIVAKMLQKFPEQRYQNVGLIAHDLTMLGGQQRQQPIRKVPFVGTQNDMRQVKTIAMSAAKFYALLGTTSLLSAALACGCMYFLFKELIQQAPNKPPPKQQTPEAAIVKSIDEDKQFATKLNSDFNERVKEAKEAKKVLEALAPVQEQDVVKDSRKQHLYLFPTTVSLGEICLFTTSNFGNTYALAKNNVYVPIDKSIGMSIHGKTAATMLEVPSVFKKIPGKDFKSLMLSIPDKIGENEELTDLSQEQVEANLARALKNIESWRNLQYVYFKDCPLNNDSVVAMGQFKDLRYLGFEFCRLDPQVLVHQEYLMKLNYICLIHTAFDPNPVLLQLSKSDNLKSLAHDRPIAIPILQQLENCKSLNTLKIMTPVLEVKNIEAMCRMKNLRTLCLSGIRLSPEQLTIVTSCPWLTSIELTAENYAPSDVIAIRARDKRIKLL